MTTIKKKKGGLELATNLFFTFPNMFRNILYSEIFLYLANLDVLT